MRLSRGAAVLAFLLVLIPSIHYVSKNRDMPEFARLHDDGLLFVSAKSLADGQGFRISSLPEQPAQTKYPVLYPLYLSILWKLNPNFPDNLLWARWFSWLLLVACLALTAWFFRREGWPMGRVLLLLALLGFNPYMIHFGSNTFSEVFFMCWLLAVFLLAQQANLKTTDRGKLAVTLLAGVLAGCAYLSRTAGIVLLVSMPAWYLWRKDRRGAVAFAAGMFPFVLGWTLWTRAHMIRGADSTLIYYTDYMKFQLLNVGFDNLHIVLWKNLDTLLYGMGSLFIPQIFMLQPVKILTQVIAVAMIVGIIRLVRRGIAVPYALFALISALMLLFWHFPPNERFVLPLCPLLIAGLITEIGHITDMLKIGFKHKDFGQRAAAGVMVACVALVFAGGLAVQCYMMFVIFDQSEASYRARLRDMHEAYTWISRNLPESAQILSSDDPLLYLYTARRGNSIPLMPRSAYAGDFDSMITAYRNIPAYCRRRGFGYVYSTGDDTARWTASPELVAAARRAVEESKELKPIFHAGFGTVYRVLPLSEVGQNR